MKPPAFDYIRAETMEEALAVLADSELEARILAGGQSLLPMLNMRLAWPKTLLDVNRLAALGKLERLATKETSTGGGEMLEVGALVRQRQFERYTAEEPSARLIYTALTHIGHPQTRNLGTVGGSLAHADPSAELPLVFLTLGGTAVLQSTRGERQVAAEDFFQSYFTTAIEPDEILTKVVCRLPAPREGTAFKEYRRRHGDFALMAAACTMVVDAKQTVQKVRLGLGGVADKPLLADEVHELVGERWMEEAPRSVAGKTVARLELADDVQASSSYRRQLATVLITHILETAYQDALAKEVTHAANQG